MYGVGVYVVCVVLIGLVMKQKYTHFDILNNKKRIYSLILFNENNQNYYI